MVDWKAVQMADSRDYSMVDPMAVPMVGLRAAGLAAPMVVSKADSKAGLRAGLRADRKADLKADRKAPLMVGPWADSRVDLRAFQTVA
jgi:hypothetical protein